MSKMLITISCVECGLESDYTDNAINATMKGEIRHCECYECGENRARIIQVRNIVESK